MNQTYVIGLPFNTRLVLSASMDDAMQQIAIRQYKLNHPAPMLSAIANVMRAGVREQFASGGNPAWKPNAPSTIAAKLSAGLPARLKSGRVPRRLMQNGGFGGSNSILIASGALRDSWGRLGAKGHLEEINESAGTVEIGSDLPVAVWMQKGTRPHDISPKAGRVLAFMGIKGMVITRKTIHHPGTAPRPIVITDDTRKAIVDVVDGYFSADSGVNKSAGYGF